MSEEQAPKSPNYEGRRDTQILEGHMTLEEKHRIDKAWNKSRVNSEKKTAHGNQSRGKKPRYDAD
jgi:hypothetical protein